VIQTLEGDNPRVRRRKDRSGRASDRGEVHDIVTPTEREARDRDIAARRRRYFLVMVPCIVLVLFGFFVPAPVPVRVAALAIASLLPPVAAVIGNS
jgi:Protein of unknown function (DUF3099)